mgnify:CR=1 FL=1
MKRFGRNAWFAAALLVLSGCMTQYTYTPPTSPQGQRCVAQCSQQQQECKARENDRVAYEQPRCEHDADIEYTACLVYSKGDKDKNACTRKSCYMSPSYYGCEEDFRQCFQVCGGTVGVMK